MSEILAKTEILKIDWPELVLIDVPMLPTLKPEYLPGWAGDFAHALAKDTETPPELAIGMVLATCATAAARRLRIMVKPNHFEMSCLWIVAALPPGNRKSAVQSAAIAPLIAWEHEQAVNLQSIINKTSSERKTLEARVKELRAKAAKEKDNHKAKLIAEDVAKLEAELPKIPIAPQLWTSDATPEKLGILLAEHEECIAWLSSEGGIFDLLQGRYSGGIMNLDLVLKGYSGDEERVDRGSRQSILLHKPRLSIGLSPQPDVLRGLVKKTSFRDRGLLGRFLYLLPKSPLGWRPLDSNPIPESIKQAYHDGIYAMLNWEAKTDEQGKSAMHLVKFSQAAYNIYHEFAKEIEIHLRPDGELSHFTDWAGKAPGMAARIAGILHGIEHAQGRPWEIEISPKTVTMALEMMTDVIEHSLAALSMMGSDVTISNASLVYEWIKRNRQYSFNVRQAYAVLRRHFNRVNSLMDTLYLLEERGYLQIIDSCKSGRGRPASPTVIVRPGILETLQ